MAKGEVLRETLGPVSVLTLNYPERRNALSLDMRSAVADALVEAMADPALRAIVLTGQGEHFCSGGDIAGMKAADSLAARARVQDLQRIARVIVEGDKPVIAAVEGFAAGAGLSLVAACDIVVAARSARFACSFNRLGLVPDLGAAWFLPMRVGMGRARHIMLTGDTFDAEAAERWGLVEILTETGGARARAVELASHIAADAAPLSNAFAKGLLARMPTSLDALPEGGGRRAGDPVRQRGFRRGTQRVPREAQGALRRRLTARPRAEPPWPRVRGAARAAGRSPLKPARPSASADRRPCAWLRSLGCGHLIRLRSVYDSFPLPLSGVSSRFASNQRVE